MIYRDNAWKRFLYRRGESRLAEVGRSGVHPDVVYKESQRWLRSRVAAGVMAFLVLGGTIVFSQEVVDSWRQVQITTEHNQADLNQAVSNCLHGLLQDALQASESPAVPADPLAYCSQQVLAQEAYMQAIAFPQQP